MPVVEALSQLFAGATALNMAYVALPDFRYRNKIAEYFEHAVKRRSDDFVIGPSTERTAEIRQKVKTADGLQTLVSETRAEHEKIAGGVPYWLAFIYEVSVLPKGEAPNYPISCDEDSLKEKHWLQKLPGRVFRNFYLKHWDNALASCSVFISLMFSVSYQAGFQLTGYSWTKAIEQTPYVPTVLTVVAVFAVLIPGIMALLGRAWICKSAYKAIDVCIKSFFNHIENKLKNDFKDNVNKAIAEMPSSTSLAGENRRG